MPKSKIIISFLICALAVSLTSCVHEGDNTIDKSSTSQTDISENVTELENDQETPSVASVSTPQVIVHEEIAERDLGEDAESPYYEIIITEDGARVYRIVRSSDGGIIDLPASETVLYFSENSDHYYEQVKYTYKLDDEDAEVTQYAIHVPDQEVGTDGIAEDDVDNNVDAVETAAN